MGVSAMRVQAETILTVGHSNHCLEVFVGLLDAHRVTALADVRTAPYSRFNPQFNREQLADTLRSSGIKYVYLGRELGGRSDDKSCYERGTFATTVSRTLRVFEMVWKE